MNTYQTVLYYAQLLILQYAGLTKAQATVFLGAAPAVMCQTSVQNVTFTGTAASGTFTLLYNAVSTASINWNDPAATIQTKLRAVTGLSTVTVTGSIASGIVTVTFTGVAAPALLLAVGTSALLTAGSVSVPIGIVETDLTLPLAVLNAFNLTGSNPAVGGTSGPLKILGKYAGVTNTVNTGTSVVTLSDADFLTLIKFAILQNNSGSSLATIVNNIDQYFGYASNAVSVQIINFYNTPASGTFVLDYAGVPTVSINWNDSAATIQADLQAIAGLGSVTVTGSIAALNLTVTFTGVIAPASILNVSSNTLLNASSVAVVVTVIPLSNIYVFDYSNMQMSYLIGSALGTTNLIEALVYDNLLPVPAAVSLSVASASVINLFFGFRTYLVPGFLNTPFNSYVNNQSSWVWLSYTNSVVV